MGGVNAGKIHHKQISTDTPSDGDVLTFDAATGKWVPTAPAEGGGGVFTDPVSYVPVISGFGTPTNVEAESWRMAGFLFMACSFNAGVIDSAVEARISLGFNGVNGNIESADIEKIPSIRIAGDAVMEEVAASLFRIVTLMEAEKGYISIGLQGPAIPATAPVNSDQFVTVGKKVIVRAMIPIDTWPS